MAASPITRDHSVAHSKYLESLHTPSAAQSRRISEVQIRKEQAIDSKYRSAEEVHAATRIQRTYRGHRERRQLAGFTLDPSSRWVELMKEWRYRNAIAVNYSPDSPELVSGRPRAPSDVAKYRWRRAGDIAEHAVGEASPSPTVDGKTPSIPAIHQQPDPQSSSTLLDLRYFLEMIDEKHRYGANLQVYHDEWQRSNTTQNFFIWLDHGDGKELDLPFMRREKLEQERVRYLSKEERMDYLVKVDDRGRLRWAKTGEPITTSADRYQDTTGGIVARPPEDLLSPNEHAQDVSFTAESPIAILAADGAAPMSMNLHRQATRDYDDMSLSDSDSPGTSPTQTRVRNPHKKHFHVSPNTILNSLLRASVKPGTWIYVADTVGRLYVGIKSSGAFQHASFLSGARISSAGAIGIENGRLTYLSPLSGHYRPKTQSFKAFVEHLKTAGTDLSGLRVSKGYAVLLGMEYYGKTKGEVKKMMRHDKQDRAQPQSPRPRVAFEDDEEPLADPGATKAGSRRGDRRGLARLMTDLNIRRSGPY